MAKKDINAAIATINRGLKADPYCMLGYMTLGSLELQRSDHSAANLIGYIFHTVGMSPKP